MIYVDDFTQNQLSEEKNMASKWKEDYNTTVHDLEVLRHEQLVLGNKLAAEQQTVEHLKVCRLCISPVALGREYLHLLYPKSSLCTTVMHV